MIYANYSATFYYFIPQLFTILFRNFLFFLKKFVKIGMHKGKKHLFSINLIKIFIFAEK